MFSFTICHFCAKHFALVVFKKSGANTPRWYIHAVWRKNWFSRFLVLLDWRSVVRFGDDNALRGSWKQHSSVRFVRDCANRRDKRGEAFEGFRSFPLWLELSHRFIQWGDYNYDYDEKSIQNSRRYDFHPMRYRFIKLQWNEHDKSAEYTLKFNGTKRGLWIGTEPPRGKRDKAAKDLCCLHPFEVGQPKM